MIQDHLSQIYLEHMRNPIGLIEAERPDFPVSGQSSMAGRVAGSLTQVWIAIDQHARLTRLGWHSRFMPRVVAGLSALAAWVDKGDGDAPGLSLEAAMLITPHDVALRLGGLPGRLIQEAIVGPQLLMDAISDYFLSIGLRDPRDGTPEAGARRTPPCGCLVETHVMLLDGLENHENDARLLERLPSCATCRAFAPSLLVWTRQRRKGERPGRT